MRPIVHLVAQRYRYHVWDTEAGRAVYKSDSYDACLEIMERIEINERAMWRKPPAPPRPPPRVNRRRWNIEGLAFPTPASA